MRRGFEIAAAVVCVGMTVPMADAHEFWINGTTRQQDGQTLLELDLKVGQMLDGISLPFVPENVTRFEWIQGGIGPIVGGLGDLPAATVQLQDQGPTIIFHRTAARRLVHNDWEKFLEYLTLEGLRDAAALHEARGLPKTGFSESYTRHAKLVLLGDGPAKLEDRYLGSPLEIVLEKVERRGAGLVIEGRVEGTGSQRSRQINVFQTEGQNVSTRNLGTKEDGTFAINLPSAGSVLLNVVDLTSRSPSDADWHSDWASAFIDTIPTE